jgi:putative ABC transport system permease protein
MLRLALRNVFRQKLRTGMTMAAIVLGVIGLILSGGFVQDVYFQLGEALIHSQSGHLQVARQGFQAYGTRSPEKFLVDQPESVRQAILKQPEVADVMARINFSGLISNGRNDLPIVGEGVEPDKEAQLGTHVRFVEGRQLEKGDADGVVLGEGIAHALKLRIGDTATISLNTADGALNTKEVNVVGMFQSFSKEYDARAARIQLAAAHELLNTTGVNSLVVSLKRTEDTARVAGALSGQLDSKQLEVKTWQQLNDFYENTVALYERQFGVLQLIILLMVLLSVANSVNMSAFERVGEFGTMMALGNRSGTVFWLVVTENTLLAFIGAGLGVILGQLLAWAISAVGIPMPPPPNANIGYTAQIRTLPSTLLLGFTVGTCATLLAALLPARRVSRTPVVDALRQNI